MYWVPLREHEPSPGEQVVNFHTHIRPPAFLDGLTDARQTLQDSGTSKEVVLSLLDAAWDARNTATVTSVSYDYWAAQIAVYRDTIGITPERDVDRRRRLVTST